MRLTAKGNAGHGSMRHPDNAVTWSSLFGTTGFAIGFFGAFTTMSTFGYETLALLEDGEWLRAAAYVAATLTLVLGGTFTGYIVGMTITRGG